MSGTVTIAGIPVIIGGNDAIIEGTEADEWILGTDDDNTIDGLAGNDLIEGEDGSDDIVGGDGDDGLLGDEGDDRLSGGAGSDVMSGGAGIDTFVLDASSEAGGDDTVVDFSAEDVLALNAAELVREDPELELTGAGLDASESFTIEIADDTDGDGTDGDGTDGDGTDSDGTDGDGTDAEAVEGPVDVVITTPAGTTTLQAVDLAALGLDAEALSFEALETAGLLVFDGLIEGSGVIDGTDNDDVIVGSESADTITGLAGDDIMTGGAESDTFNFDPSNEDEGDDVITDFEVPAEELGQEIPGDFIGLASEQVLAADPDLPDADGDGSSLTLADFDASENWDLGASDGGFVLLTHPGGTIEFQGIDAIEGLTFEDIGPILLVDGEPFPEDGIPIDGEPTDPTDPTEPTDPTDPTEPTDPTGPDGGTDGDLEGAIA